MPFFMGDTMNRPKLMGILNLTPDSFSDGGRFTEEEALVEQVRNMLAAGVDIVDVGGESTRPFAEAVSADEELRRVLPAIRAIRSLSATLPISIDTSKARVARVALENGANLVNDISALRQDEDMLRVLQDFTCPVILMHMQGTPRTMQLHPQYQDLIQDIILFFQERIAWLTAQGLRKEQLILDPGLGFGKTLEHNLTILRHLREFKKHLGIPLLVGHSRKSFLGTLLDLPLEERDCPTAVLSVLCALQGVDILRIHDVGRTATALRLAEAVT